MSHYRMHLGQRSSHQQINRLVRKLARGPVLDVGSAQGMIGQLLAGSGLEIDGVEPNATWADAARTFYSRMYGGTIEQADLPRSHYSVIVCGDVLEHTVDPVAVLRRLQDCAMPDARLIVSLPNVAHVAVRVMLLFGCFPRMDSGVLDKTHLHFYTRDTAEQMLRQVGLEVLDVSATPVPIEALGSGPLTRRIAGALMPLQHMLVDLLPRLFAMQWIFTARVVQR